MPGRELVMKLCAIYCVWGDYDLLDYSMDNVHSLVDGFIIIASEKSNFNEFAHIPTFQTGLKIDSVYHLEPDLNLEPRHNETAKRNFGLDKARELGYTHFIMMDADEFYDHQEFKREKKRIEDNDIAGLVCRLKCYFKLPTLTIGYDTTLVPFIHKITPTLRFEFNRNYPFAWTDTDSVPFTPKKRIRIDPTRSINITSGVEWSEITMHHYSWVRADVRKKIRNSTARQNLEQSTIIQDYLDAKEGYYCQFYSARLEACANLFNIPDIIDGTLKSSPSRDNPGPTGLLETDNQVR